MDEVVLEITYRNFVPHGRSCNQMWIMPNRNAAINRVNAFEADGDIVVFDWTIYNLVEEEI